jgi:pimeloyl-ACP methyl ester carboxylesterase
MSKVQGIINVKKLFHVIGVLLLVSLISAVIFLRPMSTNYLNYLIWKTATTAHSETGFIEYRGAHIHYAVYGQGDPVLLLHGGLANKLSWFSQLPWLVEAGRRVVLIDTRGHGESTHGDSGLNYQIFAEDALQVLDRLSIRRTDIIGWSDGGITALLMGLEAPERFGRIIAISANFNPSGLLKDAEQPRGKSHVNLQVSVIDWLRNLWVEPNPAQIALGQELNNLWQVEPNLTPDDLQVIIAPTLVVAGESDIIDLSHSGELAELLANGKVEIVSGAGHAAPLTHAKQINELIASFLGIELI